VRGKRAMKEVSCHKISLVIHSVISSISTSTQSQNITLTGLEVAIYSQIHCQPGRHIWWGL